MDLLIVTSLLKVDAPVTFKPPAIAVSPCPSTVNNSSEPQWLIVNKLSLLPAVPEYLYPINAVFLTLLCPSNLLNKLFMDFVPYLSQDKI